MLFESMLVIAALLLIASGGAKLVDGGPTGGALRAARLPSGRPVVSGLALIEIAAGACSLVFDHPIAAMSVAVIYLGFAGFVTLALRRGLPVQSCGCFGKRDTPPTTVHVVVNLTLATGAALAVGHPSVADRFSESFGGTLGVAVFSGIGAYLVYLMLAELPATIHAVRRTGR